MNIKTLKILKLIDMLTLTCTQYRKKWIIYMYKSFKNTSCKSLKFHISENMKYVNEVLQRNVNMCLYYHKLMKFASLKVYTNFTYVHNSEQNGPI